MRALLGEGVDEPGDMRVVGPDGVLAVRIGRELDDLRMGGDDVVRLGEGLHHHLPVGRHLLHGVERHVALLEIELREVLDEYSGVALERFGGRVEVHHHEALPDGHLGLGQVAPSRVAGHVREVPFARQVGQVAVDVPRPGVERAAERGHPAVVGAQFGAAVQAGVVERADLPVGAAGDQQRLVAHVVHHVTAGLG